MSADRYEALRARNRQRADEVIAEVEHLLAAGHPVAEIGPAVGKHPPSLVRYLYRWGRPDLARACNPYRIPAA